MTEDIKKLLGEIRLYLTYFYYLVQKDDESAEWTQEMSDETLLKYILSSRRKELVKYLRSHLKDVLDDFKDIFEV